MIEKSLLVRRSPVESLLVGNSMPSLLISNMMGTGSIRTSDAMMWSISNRQLVETDSRLIRHNGYRGFGHSCEESQIKCDSKLNST